MLAQINRRKIDGANQKNSPANRLANAANPIFALSQYRMIVLPEITWDCSTT